MGFDIGQIGVLGIFLEVISQYNEVEFDLNSIYIALTVVFVQIHPNLNSF